MIAPYEIPCFITKLVMFDAGGGIMMPYDFPTDVGILEFYNWMGLTLLAYLFTPLPFTGLTGLLATFFNSLKILVFHFFATRPARYVRRRTALMYIALASVFIYGPAIYADIKLRQAGFSAPNLTISYKGVEIPLPASLAFIALIGLWIRNIIRDRG
jgi:hypothetical protein